MKITEQYNKQNYKLTFIGSFSFIDWTKRKSDFTTVSLVTSSLSSLSSGDPGANGKGPFLPISPRAIQAPLHRIELPSFRKDAVKNKKVRKIKFF